MGIKPFRIIGIMLRSDVILLVDYCKSSEGAHGEFADFSSNRYAIYLYFSSYSRPTICQNCN